MPSAPSWAKAWRRLANRFIKMARAARLVLQALAYLGARPYFRTRLMCATEGLAAEMRRSVLSLDRDEKEKDKRTKPVAPQTCDHNKEDGSGTAIHRYGNAHGSYARCNVCMTRWKYNKDTKSWVVHPVGASSSSSSRLPLPCSGASPASQTTRRSNSSFSTTLVRGSTYTAPTAKSAPGPRRPTKIKKEEPPAEESEGPEQFLMSDGADPDLPDFRDPDQEDSEEDEWVDTEQEL